MPYLVLFAPGYVRVSLRNYDISDTDLGTHLTNQVKLIHDAPLCQTGGSVLKPLISAPVKAPASIFGTMERTVSDVLYDVLCGFSRF